MKSPRVPRIIVALTIEAVGEALLFAAKGGADPARVREALMGVSRTTTRRPTRIERRMPLTG